MTADRRCQHCGVKQFDNPHADPALSAMAHLCWRCVKPWKETHHDTHR